MGNIIHWIVVRVKTTTRITRGDKSRWISQLLGYLLVLLLPTMNFWPVGKPISPNVLPIYVTPGLYVTDLIALSLVLLGLGHVLRNKQAIHDLTAANKLLLILPVLLIVLLAFLTSPAAISPALARYTALRWLMAASLCLALVVLNIPVKRMVPVFLVGMAIQAGVGVGQAIHQAPLNLPGELALSINQSRAAVVIIEGSSWLRAYGLTFHPNVLGGFLCSALILGVPLLDRWWLRVVWWMAALGLLLSFSRSAWLAAAIVLPATILLVYLYSSGLRRPLRFTLIPVGIIILIGIIMFANQLTTRLNPWESISEIGSISGRGQMLSIALDAIYSHPLAGIGAGNFPLVMQMYKTIDLPHYVHNVSFLLAAEIGIFGGLIWYWLWLVPILKIKRFMVRKRIFALVLIAAWFSWGVISLWDSYPWALESGRLFSIMLLTWITQECLS